MSNTNIYPQVSIKGQKRITTYSWSNGTMSSGAVNTIGTVSNGDGFATNRMYIVFSKASMPENARVKKAELKIFQSGYVYGRNAIRKIGLYQVTENITTGTCTPAIGKLIDVAGMKVGSGFNYTFDVTSLYDSLVTNGPAINLVVKVLDEDFSTEDYITIHSTENTGDQSPTVMVSYEEQFGMCANYPSNTHQIGNISQGMVSLQTGLSSLDIDDFMWQGNRMPVSIKHLYCSNLPYSKYTDDGALGLNAANFSNMFLGYGYRLNVMQSMVSTSFSCDGVSYSGYLYIDENGDVTRFKPSLKQYVTGNIRYNIYEGVNDEEILYNHIRRELTKGTETHLFDTDGRLIQIKDEFGNHMDITYTSNRLTSVTDGAGREFVFAYNDSGFLTSITAPDNTSVSYGYNGNYLNSITYPDGRKLLITYWGGRPKELVLTDSVENNVHKIEYTFNDYKLGSVTEYGVKDGAFVMCNKSTYSYSPVERKTVVEHTVVDDTPDDSSDDKFIEKTVYTFDDDGNILGEYAYSDEYGSTGTQGSASGIYPYASSDGTGIVYNVDNLIKDHSFEVFEGWDGMLHNGERFSVESYMHGAATRSGMRVLHMTSNDATYIANGMYQATGVLPAGQYTFSAYARVMFQFAGGNSPGVYIRVTKPDDTVLAVSEHISKADTDYTRLIAPFELTEAGSVKVELLMDGAGSVYFDSLQLENNPYANDYNMLENSNFERNANWNLPNGAEYSNDCSFNMTRSVKITGDLDSKRNVNQGVDTFELQSSRQTFTLSGWAKGTTIPNRAAEGFESPTFRLRAVLSYNMSSEEEEYVVDFSPYTEEWQFASIQFTKKRYEVLRTIRVYCEYDYNSGVVYFDNIQLLQNCVDKNLTAEDFATEIVPEETEESNDEKIDETSDDIEDFEEVKDAFGNTLTETTFTDGEFGTIYKAFGFTPDGELVENAGNDLVYEIDARGNRTEYTVDEATSRNEEITDRLGNKTAYEYDEMGKTTKVTSKKATLDENGNNVYETVADVSYDYDAFDNMTEIVRGDGLKYVLKYNAFHNLESIGIDGKTEKLVNYTYKDGNGRLKEITYANGDTMKATYNSAGQMVAEKWFNKANTLVAHYKYAYDAKGNIVRSIDVTSSKEYNYIYEADKLVRATESSIALNDEIITSKTVICTIRYTYDSEDKLIKKQTIFFDGSEQTVYYENSDDANSVVKFVTGGKTVTSHSKNDSFGRKEFDELQLGTGFVSRQFHYEAGEVTGEHVENSKLKSSATTQLVSHIALSDGRTLSYEYDAEERITKVIDSVDGTTEYTYDSLGQLLTEVHDGTTVNTMTYDNYGNIVSKNGVAYTYGDATWKDLLTDYGDQSITYDAQGNPTSYLGHTLTWEKGRQLKSYDGVTYTYNANGIRTSKTVDEVTHFYTLDGTRILKETWGSNSLIPLYDNEETVCGIDYNGEPYYFHKNLQGDIIAIADKNSNIVARYSYDAWGVCTITEDTSENNIATVNPFRYRGYYYDNESGFYYLQSRYYNPVVGRFVNADEALILGMGITPIGYNLFYYCENDPVNCVDFTGYVVTPANVIGAVVGLILGAVGGYFLSRFLADKIGLKGWKRTAFIVGVSAVIAASATVIGYFIGPYIGKAFKALLNGLRGLFKPKIGTKLGKLGTLTRNTKPVIKGLTNHGLQRMLQRGISKTMAQKIIKTGYAIAQGGGKVLYFTKEGVVVLNALGQVVTAYSSAYFDEAMQAIVSMFYK